jgi:hypothetical protein
MWSINPFTNPNPVYSHTHYVIILLWALLLLFSLCVVPIYFTYVCGCVTDAIESTFVAIPFKIGVLKIISMGRNM